MSQPVRSDEPTSDWDTAEDRATLLRLKRTEPPAARRLANRLLAVVMVALWIVSITTQLLSHFNTQTHHGLRLAGSGTALALIVIGVVWLFVSGRFRLGGRYDSPWTPLTKTDRRRIRRQLARKAPLEFDHTDVVLELAHQQRRQTLGSLAILAMELPNTLGVTLTSTDPVVLALSCTGLVLFIGAGIYGIAVAIRLSTPVQQLTQAATNPPQ